LQVSPGQTLALIGNRLSATGGILSSVSGNIQLGSVQDGLIRFNPTLPGWGFDYAGIQNFADIDLSQKSLVNVSGLGGGSIQFHGQNIRLTEGSVALLQNFGSQPSGQISINATGQFELGGITPNGSPGSSISSETLRLGAGANIQVTARQLSFQDGGRLTAFTFGAGQSGSITVNATNFIEINGFLPASPITSSLIGVGNAGFGATGNSGFIHITTAHLRLLNSGSVSSLTFGTGAAGDVQVDATESIDLIGVNPLTLVPSVITTGTFNAGNAGNLTINTTRLSLRQGGAIGSSSPATGKAGNISIQASESILVSDMAPGSISSSRIASVAEILDPVTQSVFRLPPIPQSNSGSVTIATPLLQVQNRGRVTVKNEGTGNAGQLSIQANTLRLENGFIEAKTASGQGGNINLQVQDMLLLNHSSEITTTSGNTGDGGNITINSPVILGLENSDIIANAVQGRGGNINITTQGIIGLEFRNTLTPRVDLTNDITASSQFNVNGTVQINNIGVDPSSGLVELPVNVTDPSQQIATGCAHNTGSSFVATGRGGIPQNPTQDVKNDVYDGLRTWSDIRDISAYRTTQQVQAQIPKSPEILVQAIGWRRNAIGKIELFANKSPNLLQQPLTCAAVPES
jgi:large exoprotein involved in heme utilization and adhesion